MTYKVLFIRLSEQIHHCPAHRTHQYGPRVAEDKNFHRGSRLFVGQTLPVVQTTSLPLSSLCSGCRLPLAPSRTQKRFHRQAVPRPDRGCATGSSSNRHAHQRTGSQGVAGIFTEARAGASWLKDPARVSSGASGCQYQTVMDRRNWPKFTRCWCRRLRRTHHR